MTSSSILNTFAAATNNRSRLKANKQAIYHQSTPPTNNNHHHIVDDTNRPMETTTTTSATTIIKSSNQQQQQEKDAASSPKSSFTSDYKPITSANSSSSSISVRLLVFLEDCDGTRSVIFDSGKFSNPNHHHHRSNRHDNTSSGKTTTTATTTTTTTTKSTSVDISNNFNKSSLSSPHLSNEMMIRMVFGSFPMKVSNNVAIKVHALKNSNKAMISNVFTYYNTERRDSQQHEKCECLRSSTLSTTTTVTTSTTDYSDENQKTIVKEDKPTVQTNTNIQQLTPPPPPTTTTTATIPIIMSNSKPINISTLTSKSLTHQKLNNQHQHRNRYKQQQQQQQQQQDGSPSVSTKITDTDLVTTTMTTNSSESSSLSSPVLQHYGQSSLYQHNHQIISSPPSSSSGTKSRLNSNSYSTSNSTILNTTTCSSVPTAASYESYTTIYKRLMRSLSNSLISSESVNNQDSGGEHQQQQPSFKQSQFSSSSRENMPECYATISPSICQKCIEENCYPKYKIGVSVIYCFPTTSKSQQKASHSNENNAEKAQNQSAGAGATGGVAFESFFPSAPSSPYSSSFSSSSSPTISHHIVMPDGSSPGSSVSRDSAINSDNDSNEDYYEFFFSHLPLIEYQFKEMRQKIITFLPAYFANNPKYNKKSLSTTSQFNQTPLFYLSKNIIVSSGPSSHRNSISSTNSCGGESTSTSNINRSTSSLHSLPGGAPTQTNSSSSSMSSFSRLVLNELRSYESRVNLLFSAPRLVLPAWLALNSNRLDSSAKVSHRLIQEFVYLNTNLLPTTTTTQSIRVTVQQQAAAIKPSLPNRLLLDFNVKKLLFYNRIPKGESQSLGNNRHNYEEQQKIRIDENKSKNKRFMSTILSAVLRHHLSWVYTVQPANEGDTTTTMTTMPTMSSNLRKHIPGWTRLLEKLNPYNTLWAQLSDLHGAVNHPLKLVRTVVVGQNRPLVERLLFVLSYFIRCGSSSYYDVVQDEFDFERLSQLGEQQHSTTTTTTTTTNESSNDINVSELKFDPLSQFNSLILTANAQSTRHGNSSSSSSQASSSSSSSSSSSFHAPFATDSPKMSNNSVKNRRRLLSNVNGRNCSAQELPLIGCQMKQNLSKSTRMHDNFGFSLLASYCPEFLFEFVLHGTSDRSFLSTLSQRLKFSKHHSILDCPIDESIYIVVDVDSFDVKVYSSERDGPVVEKPVNLVDSLFESLIDMISLFKDSEFVLLHLEDKLQELYTKSMALNKIKSQSADLGDAALMELIELNDPQDLEFLNQIISALTIPSF